MHRSVWSIGILGCGVFLEQRFDNAIVCVCLCVLFCMNVFDSAGLSWEEEAETYESSFYKRSLDNDLYIFTPKPYPRDNSE